MAVATKRPADPSSVAKDTADHVLVSWSAQGGIKQVVITRAEGSWLYAGERRILDFSSGLINVNLGHGHPKVVRAIQEQAERACYVTPSFGEESRATLARLLAEITPGDLSKTIFTTGGSEAISFALDVVADAGDEVIVPAMTFASTAFAVSLTGARPVIVDVREDDALIDPEEIERAITSRTKAIIPVHLYGQCADMAAICAVARAHSLAVIEDAAQAFGAGWRGQRAGALGRAAGFSFYPTKNLSAFGDAGCITTSDVAVVERARSLRNHGSTQRYYHQEIGWNSRLDAIQASVLRVKMTRVQQWNEQRRQRAATYDQLFRKAKDIEANDRTGS